MPFIRAVVCLVVSAIPISLTYAQDDPFKAPVRPTEPLSPQDELKTFNVPEGFEVQLFASDPDLLKPMNLAFDAKGRLWASMSREYPYAAPLDQPGRDAIKILEDTDGDGTSDKITTFADGLNIPIGLYPYKNGVIAWSIPNIWYFEDTDGDDKADKRTILYGPMGFER
ncbi:MAG TPA: sorbosone dehydrogenase, partial [Planctomycetaceae bacterium]|nr:sorbosone dehydrogenase [Planctomycetaceae bacterium]